METLNTSFAHWAELGWPFSQGIWGQSYVMHRVISAEDDG